MNIHSGETLPKNQDNVENNSDKFTRDEEDLNKLQPKLFNMQKLVDGASSASNAGILYYKCISEEMGKKISELQKAIEQAESTMGTQKQNIEDMINRKNKLLCDFHEQFRKFTRKTEYENRMEDEIEHLIKFLDDLMPLHNEISHVKTSEINIRNYIMEKFQAICTELQPVKEIYENNVEQLQLKTKKLKERKSQWEICNKLNSNINHTIRLHEEELNHVGWSLKNEIADVELIRNEGERIQIQTNAEILEKQQTLKNDAMKIQHAFYSIKNEFSTLQNKLKAVTQIKEQLANYNDVFVKNDQEVIDIEANITKKKLEHEELQKKIDMNSSHLNDLEDRKRIQIEKQGQLCDILRKYKESIVEEETLLNNLLEKERLIEGKRKQIVAKIKNQKEKKIGLLEEKNFTQEVTRNEILMKDINDLNQKNNSTKKRLLELNIELESKMKIINELKNNLLSNDIIKKNKTLDTDFLLSYLSVENEEYVTSEFIDTELDSLFDQICEQQSYVEDLEDSLEEYSTEKHMLAEETAEKEKRLQNAINSTKICDNSILVLKQNVYQGKYITLQELNRQLMALTNHVKNEQNMVAKIKEEIKMQVIQESGKNKRRLLSPEKRRNLTSSASRVVRSKKKVEESEEANKKGSLDNDIYSFN